MRISSEKVFPNKKPNKKPQNQQNTTRFATKQPNKLLVDAMKQLDTTKVTVAFKTVNEIPFGELVAACPTRSFWKTFL
jgi:hypothetical protein